MVSAGLGEERLINWEFMVSVYIYVTHITDLKIAKSSIYSACIYDTVHACMLLLQIIYISLCCICISWLTIDLFVSQYTSTGILQLDKSARHTLMTMRYYLTHWNKCDSF